MQNTTNYNFNLPEGTDLWNYLTQTNPNFTALDTILKSVSDATVTTATEVASGTAHAITRTLPDANVIRFTATAVWTLGDTMTIDGTPVTVVKPNGTSLQTGDYIIGSEVLGILRATQFTVYVGGGASTIDADDVTYDNTSSGLAATDVQNAIDELDTSVDTINSNLSQISLNLSNINTYSTTEKEVGTWVGSKRLYRRTWIDTSSHNSNFTLDANFTSSLYTVVGSDIVWSQTGYFNLGNHTLDSAGYRCEVGIGGSGLEVKIQQYTITGISVTLLYTKNN